MLEDRTLLATGPADLVELHGPADQVASQVAPGAPLFYRIDPASAGRLTAVVHALGAGTRLSLLDAQHRVLVQSDGQSAAAPDPRIDQHVPAGTFYFEVESLDGIGVAALTATLTTTSAPFAPIATGTQPTDFNAVAVGAFNGDDIPDFATIDGIHLGAGDGTFRPATGPALTAVATDPSAVLAGDFNGDGKVDLAVADYAGDRVAILTSNGDGTFQAPRYVAAGPGPNSLVAGDFTGAGHLDLAVADSGPVDDDGNPAGPGGVTILAGDGAGHFATSALIPAGRNPAAIAAGDFAGDGRTGLAVANYHSDDVTILAAGGGTFRPVRTLPVGSAPDGIAAGDFNGDGKVDLAVADSANPLGPGGVTILPGNGDGTFRPPIAVAAGLNPSAIVAGAFTGAGHADLAVADFTSDDVTILTADGAGGFRIASRTTTAVSPYVLAAADLDRDGRTDVVVAGFDASGNPGTAILLGNGDGAFNAPTPPVGPFAAAIVLGDFTGSGHVDLAVANNGSADVSILPGRGDGTYAGAIRTLVGANPFGLATGDFNGDGRADLAVADYGSLTSPGSPGGVSILLGNGDGTFRALGPIPAGLHPHAIFAGDFTGDGKIDLAVADSGGDGDPGGVTILAGDGRGKFRVAGSFLAGANPRAIVAGHFTGTGRLDLAVVDGGSGAVAILRNDGRGGFTLVSSTPAGTKPGALVAGDFNGDGRADLAVADYGPFDGSAPGGVTILLGRGAGTFRAPIPVTAGANPFAIAAGDFDRDGRTDLAVANAGSDDVSILLGRGDGTFRPGAALPVGPVPQAIAAGDLNGDGVTDLAITPTQPSALDVRLGGGGGQFSAPEGTDQDTRNAPVVGDFTGDGTADVAVVDATGAILVRRGRPGHPGAFDPPVTANPGLPARDIAAIGTGRGVLIAAADAGDDAVTLYGFNGARFLPIGTLPTGAGPTQILSADLDGRGSADLLILNGAAGTVTLYRGDGRGGFLPRVDLAVEAGASGLTVADLSGSGRLDLLVSDATSGAVRVVPNRGGGIFGPPVLYRAGVGPYGYGAVGLPSSPGISSPAATSGVVAGAFTPGGRAGLVALDPGTDALARLSALGGGRFANPVTAAAIRAARAPVVVPGGKAGPAELAVLTATGLTVYRDDGRGGFAVVQAIKNVGADPTGLTVADVDGDGRPDLLIGNPAGDVLTLVNRRDGTFGQPDPVDRRAALAVALGKGGPEVAVAAPGLDLVLAGKAGGPPTTVLDAAAGLIAPGAVKLTDLNGDGILDLIVANSGANDVLIYPGLGGGHFGSPLDGGHGIAVGTDPVGITVADVNGDGRPDLVVADRGSDDVAILLNATSASGVLGFAAGPRLKAGQGPTATVVADLYGAGTPDILVSNGGSNDVTILRGLGLGSFDDVNPRVIPVNGIAPGALVLGNFTGQLDLVTVNSGSNSLSLIRGIGGVDPVAQAISSGGLVPVAAVTVADPDGGMDGLLVANRGDGHLALFPGGPDGFRSPEVFTEPGLPNPAALAAGGPGQFFILDEASQSAVSVILGLGGISPPGSSGGGGGGAEGGPSGSQPAPGDQAVAILQPLGGSSLALVATLLSVAVEGAGESGAVPVQGAPPNQALLRAGAIPEPGPVGEPGAGAAGSAPTTGPAPVSPLVRLVTGLDEAFARARDDARGGALDADAPPIAAPADASRAVDAALDSLGAAEGASGEAAPRFGLAAAEGPSWLVGSLALTLAAWPLADLARPGVSLRSGPVSEPGRAQGRRGRPEPMG